MSLPRRLLIGLIRDEEPKSRQERIGGISGERERELWEEERRECQRDSEEVKHTVQRKGNQAT